MNRRIRIFKPPSSEFFFETHPARAPMQRETTLGRGVGIGAKGGHDGICLPDPRTERRPPMNEATDKVGAASLAEFVRMTQPGYRMKEYRLAP